MRQFKLIKEYPGSPTLDSIAIFNEKELKYSVRDGNNSFTFYQSGFSMIENYPQFWEEIKENYFPHLFDDKIVVLETGECFLLGDKVRLKNGKCTYVYFIIDNFFRRKDGMLLARSKNDEICEDVTTIEKWYDNEFLPKFSIKDIHKAIQCSGESTPTKWLIDAIEFKKRLGL